MRSTRRLALGASLLASLAIAGTAGGGAIVSAQEDPVFQFRQLQVTDRRPRLAEGPECGVDRRMNRYLRSNEQMLQNHKNPTTVR